MLDPFRERASEALLNIVIIKSSEIVQRTQGIAPLFVKHWWNDIN